MENKEKKLKRRTYQGSLLSVLHFLSGLVALGYSIFLVMSYQRSVFFGSLFTFAILFFYLWSLYADIKHYKEEKISTAKGIFSAILGLFIIFFLNIFVCANSVRYVL